MCLASSCCSQDHRPTSLRQRVEEEWRAHRSPTGLRPLAGSACGSRFRRESSHRSIASRLQGRPQYCYRLCSGLSAVSLRWLCRVYCRYWSCVLSVVVGQDQCESPRPSRGWFPLAVGVGRNPGLPAAASPSPFLPLSLLSASFCRRCSRCTGRRRHSGRRRSVLPSGTMTWRRNGHATKVGVGSTYAVV